VATVLAVIAEAVGNLGAASADNPGGWSLSIPTVGDDVFGLPDFATLFQFNLFGAFSSVEGGVLAALLLVFSLLLADFFDTMGTMTAIGAEAGLNDEEGVPPNAQRILMVDSVAAIAGGAAGVSSNTSCLDAAWDLVEGSRTRLAYVGAGLVLLVPSFFSPLSALIASEAAVPALVPVGFLMLQQVTEIDWRDVELAIPAFLTIVVMPFTYSISAGIGAGFISFVLIKLVVGKVKDIHPLLWLVAVLFVVYFAYSPISSLVN